MARTTNPADAATGAAALSAAASNPGGTVSPSTTATDAGAVAVGAPAGVPVGPVDAATGATAAATPGETFAAAEGGSELPTPFTSPGAGAGNDAPHVAKSNRGAAAGPAADTTAPGFTSHQWHAYVVDKAGAKRRRLRVETPRGSEFTAEQAKEHTQVTQYDWLNKDRPQSIEVEMIDPANRRPANLTIPTVQGGRVVGGKRL